MGECSGLYHYTDILHSFKRTKYCCFWPGVAYINLRHPTFHPNTDRGNYCRRTRKEKKLIIDLPRLINEKADCLQVKKVKKHPVTGMDERYYALDRLHEKNWNGKQHKLRSLKLVLKLQKCGSQICEQLNRKMGRNNFFMNTMNSYMQLFSFRLMIHLHFYDVVNRRPEISM